MFDINRARASRGAGDDFTENVRLGEPFGPHPQRLGNGIGDEDQQLHQNDRRSNGDQCW